MKLGISLKTKIRNLAGKLLFELTIVSLGILLALAVNSWSQAYQQREEAHQLLQKIEYETMGNLSNLKQVNIAFAESLKLTDNYISGLGKGEEIELNYTVNILAVDFAVWEFTKHREELDQLPVDVLIAISDSYRALEKAESLTRELAFTKFRNITDNFKNEKSDTLREISIELNQVKFHLDIAQAKLKNTIKIIEQYNSV